MLQLQPGEPVGLLRPRQLGLGRFGEVQKKVAMRLTHQGLLAAGDETFQAEFADRLEHEKAGFAIGLFLLPEQVFIDERGQPVEHAKLPPGDGPAHAFGRFKGMSPDEHGQPAKEPLFVFRQEIVAPGDGFSERPVPGGQVACTAGQQVEAMLQTRQDGPRREHLDAGRCQFDGQRQPVEPDADFGYGGGVFLAQGKGRTHGARPLHEERHGLVLPQAFERGQALGIRDSQGRYGKLVLALHVQRCPAGHQDLEFGAGCKQVRHQRSRLDDLLEIV